MSWCDLTLGDALRVEHGFAFKSEFFQPEGQLLVVTPGNFLEPGGFRVRPGKERYYAGDFPERYLLKRDDLIIAMTEQGEGLLGSAARIPDDKGFLHNQRIGLVKILSPRELNKRFVYWLFNSASVRAQIRGSASGTKVRHTAPERIYKVRVRVPCVEDQAQIASVLDAYNDLIENNRRRIALLEESARLLYHEWFVDLRFPGHEAVPVKDGVPKGWQRLPFSDVADFINGFAFKPEHLHDTGLPVVKIPELRDGISSKTPYNDGSIVPLRNHIDTGDVLFSWSATLLVNEWGEGPALLNQHLFKIVPKRVIDKRLVRFAVEAAIPQLLGHSVGATMQHIRRSALDDHTMLQPTIKIASDFAVKVDPMMDSVLNLKAQIRLLVEARNALLPKLMSGEIAV